MSRAVTTAMPMRRRLYGDEIGLLRLLCRRGAAAAPARLGARLNRFRRAAVEPWRRGLVLVWYRQAPDVSPSLQGPYFTLSDRGLFVAEKFVRRRP